jgi:methyl-accepting chemotaxis protein
MAENVRPYRRKQYFIAKKFQTKYVGLFLLFMFLTGALCAYVIYYTTMVLMGEKLANVYPQGRLIAIINSVNLRILLSLVMVAPLVVIISIFLSHKIAGPMYRMEKFLTAMAGGDFSSRITLRKGDELKTLAERMNFFVDSMRLLIGGQKSHMNNALTDLNNLKKALESKSADKAHIAGELDKLTNDINGLNRELEKLKT